MTATPREPSGCLWDDERIATLAEYAAANWDAANVGDLLRRLRDDYEHELAAARARVAALEAAQAWEPVADDIYNTDGPEVLYVKGQLLSIVGEFYVYLPADMRLCRRVARAKEQKP